MSWTKSTNQGRQGGQVFILDRFGISFHKGVPAGECVVLLYAVNDDLYKKIKQWFKEERLGGMPMLPDRYRLDLVSLDIL